MLFQDRTSQFVIESNHLVKELRVLDMVGLLVAVVWQLPGHHLLISDVLEMQKLALILILLIVEVLASVRRLREEPSLT